jgi:NAD(P)-dependent dehydrogenase (short-subunit alcohol dehydrogenase family)
VNLSSIPRPAAALVVGASGGLGAALLQECAAAGFEAHGASRSPQSDGLKVDITDEASIAAMCVGLAELSQPLRLVIVATGLLHQSGLQPEKSMRALDGARMAQSFAVNAIGPALVAKHVLPLLPRSGKCVFAVLSARVGSIADNRMGGWYAYRASKAALNQIVRTLAIETGRTRPDTILAALHPGTVATALSAPFRGQVSPDKLFTPVVAAQHLTGVIDRLSPADSGGFFAWDGAAIPF